MTEKRDRASGEGHEEEKEYFTMNTWNIQWKNPWKKTIALGSAVFLLGGSAVYAASPPWTQSTSSSWRIGR